MPSNKLNDDTYDIVKDYITRVFTDFYNSFNSRAERFKANKDRDINLHLFVRKYKKLDGKSEPYIYIGKGDTAEFEGEQPITVKLKLEHEVPAGIYREFVEKV